MPDDKVLTAEEFEKVELEVSLEENVRLGYAEKRIGPDGRAQYRITEKGAERVEAMLRARGIDPEKLKR